MTNKIHTYQKRGTLLLYAPFIILLLAMMWGCIDESVNDIPTTGDKGRMVIFSLKVPNTTTPETSEPSTYALSDDDEKEITTIIALPFGSNGRTIAEPIYLSTEDITPDPVNTNIKTFTIVVREDAHSVVVFANINPNLIADLNTITAGQSKEWVANKLLVTNDGKWNATRSSTDYIPIPMWGDATIPSLSSSDAPVNVPVTLIRMLSKIDIVLTTATAKDKLDLQSVRLYNYNNKGQVAPAVSNWTTVPSIPSMAQKPSNPEESPLLYDSSTINKDGANRGISSVNEMYTFEAAAGSGIALLQNTCVVIGGKYNGANEDSYYRIDFANTEGTGASATTTYLNLLRNFNYKINIDDIKGAGFSTPEEAFRAPPVNIVTNIVNWNDAQMGDINFDGQYILGVSKGAFVFSREARTLDSKDNTLNITTDYPTGWKVEKIVDDANNNIDWLSLSPNRMLNDATTNAKIVLTENSSGAKRKGFIHLSAGRITYLVKVEQSAAQDLSISIVDGTNQPVDSLLFASRIDVAPPFQNLTLSWLPSTSTITYVNTPENNPFLFADGTVFDDIPSSGAISDPSGLGAINYKIAPPAITTTEINSDPFYERSSSILYTLSDGATAVYKVVNFRQIAYNMIPKVEEMYKMDGEMKSFSVRSNTPFTVSVKQETNANNVISQLSTSGEANTSEQGTAVKFKIIDDITNPIVLQREVKVTISSPENLFDDYDVTLKCKSAVVQPESNSYIVAPDGLGILIPVSRANRSKMGNQVVATTSLTADLVWTDNLNGLAANSNIKSIKITGSGSDRYLYVTPGTAPGNALVAIKSGNKILWSWHIWVTNYNPLPIGTGKFMDRNLGAISNTPGAIATRGFLYQWGRKDPFQGSQTLYNASGDAIEEVSIEIYSSISKSYFNDSFANPTLLYSYRYGTRDWIGTGVGFRDDNLWSRSNSQKTIYDPCPPGWRVPELTIWNGLNNSNFSWDATNKGRTNAGYGGYYPAAGYRSAGNNENVGTQGYCWSTSISSGGFFGSNEGYSFGLSFTSNSVSVAQDNRSRSDALSVRCVKE